MMRTLRTATPIPQPSYDDTVCPEILPSRKLSLASSTHLPTLREGSLALSRIAPPVFAPSELGKTEIIALVGSPSHPRRGQLFKSALERRRRSQEISRLPNLISGENVDPDCAYMTPPASPEWVELRLRRPEQNYELTRAVSHPVLSHSTLAARTTRYSNSKSLPKLDSAEPSRTLSHSAELRRHIQQEEMDYDLHSTKAVILERFLKSQS